MERMYMEYNKDAMERGADGPTWTAWWGGVEIGTVTRCGNDWYMTSYVSDDFDMTPAADRTHAVMCLAQLCN